MVYFLLKFSKIKVGAKCSFWGLPLFVRHADSTINIGDNCNFHSIPISNLSGISKKCMISTYGPNAAIKIGHSCGFSGTAIIALISIEIGNNVLIGANSFIMDFDGHNIDPVQRLLPVSKGKPIKIEDNVFIGYTVTILKGVTIGENSVIGANSVVVSDIPPNCIAGGNPCKVISKIRI